MLCINLAGRTEAASGHGFRAYVDRFIMEKCCPDTRVVDVHVREAQGVYQHISKSQLGKVERELSKLSDWGGGGLLLLERLGRGIFFCDEGVVVITSKCIGPFLREF